MLIPAQIYRSIYDTDFRRFGLVSNILQKLDDLFLMAVRKLKVPVLMLCDDLFVTNQCLL